MEQMLTICGRLPSLNEIIGANRKNRYLGAKQKQDVQERIKWSIRSAHLKPITGKLRLEISFYEETKKRDPDNVISATKFILDSFVEMGVIQDDSQKFLSMPEPYRFLFFCDKQNPRIEVKIYDES